MAEASASPEKTVVSASTDEELQEKRKQKTLTALFLSAYLSVAQHVITIQSELMLIKELVGGDTALAARAMGNTQGLVGLLGIVANQVGGRLSDAVGRKPLLMLGPLANVFFGLIVFTFSKRLSVVLPVRVMRLVLTTFSSTVMLQPAMADVVSGKDLALASTKIGAYVGAGIISMPFLEAFLLKRTGGSPRFSYLALSALAALHSALHAAMTPETLEVKKRKSLQDCLSASTFNPFGFINIFTKGTIALQKMVSMVTLQMFLEGKNMSDIVEIWKRDHLHWGMTGSRNFIVTYGMAQLAAAQTVTPKMLKAMSVRGFTTATNLLNAFAFFVRGSAETSLIFLLAVLPMLPGVNGSAANAMRAPINDIAVAQGFGKGEFSAWTNNLRAIAGSAATVMYGNYYAWARKHGIPPGTTFMVAGAVGAILPQMILMATKDEEMTTA